MSVGKRREMSGGKRLSDMVAEDLGGDDDQKQRVVVDCTHRRENRSVAIVPGKIVWRGVDPIPMHKQDGVVPKHSHVVIDVDPEDAADTKLRLREMKKREAKKLEAERGAGHKGKIIIIEDDASAPKVGGKRKGGTV